MKRAFIVLFSTCAVLSTTPMTAQAGQATDALSQCLVSNVTEQDKTALVKWAFSLMARHPDVAPLANISATQQTELNTQVGAVFTRLIGEDCATQVKTAVAQDGQASLQVAFKVLGETATAGLMTHPGVASGAAEIINYVDLNKVAQALR